jgi:hypothetical protein
MKKWQIEHAEPQRIESFHDWFCALINVLEQLQQKLQLEEQTT